MNCHSSIVNQHRATICIGYCKLTFTNQNDIIIILFFIVKLKSYLNIHYILSNNWKYIAYNGKCIWRKIIPKKIFRKMLTKTQIVCYNIIYRKIKKKSTFFWLFFLIDKICRYKRWITVIFDESENELSVKGPNKKHREVFLRELIRDVTHTYNVNCPNDISKSFNECAAKLWQSLDEKCDAEIISIFDKSIDWIKVFKAIESELDFYKDKETAKTLFIEINNVLTSFPTVSSRLNTEFFPSRDDLEKYLSYYYSISCFLFNHSNLLYEEYTGEKDNETLCELLTHVPAKKDCSIYSPYCAEALLTLYDSLSDLYLKSESQIDSFVLEMVYSAFSIKSFRRFRHYVIRDFKQTLLSCENTDRFLEKKSINLSSYELIRPVRLFGKIRRHSDYIYINDDVLVTIFGAVYIDVNNLSAINFDKNQLSEDDLKNYSYEMYQLYNWLRTDPDTKQRRYKIDIFINQNGFKSFNHSMLAGEVLFNLGKIKIRFLFNDYKKLCQKTVLESIITDNQLLLFLDCPFVYENTKTVLENTTLSDYFVTMPDKYPSKLLSLSEFGPIQKVQMQLNTALLSNLGKIGIFERKLKEQFLEYISDAVNEKSKTEAFVFISSQRSINTSRYIRRYVVRTEKYNGKEIGLLHFGNQSETHLIPFNTNEKSNSIVFSFWNIIVNTDVSLIDEWEKRLNNHDHICSEYLASKILIEIRWANDATIFNSINIRVSEKFSETEELFLNDSIRSEMISIIRSYFDTIFNSSEILKPIINCMQNSFYNVFFSKIDNVYEIFAFQRLREKLSVFERIEIETVEIVESHQITHNDTNELTRYKKMYVDVISNLSQNVPSESIRDILVAIMRENNMDVYNVYDEILRVCDDLGFNDTFLFKNTLAARGKL